MVDFQTQYRLYGYKYTSPQVLQATSTNRDIYRENQQYVFKTPRVEMHDCRPDAVKQFSDLPEWEAHILSHGMKKTVDAAASLRVNPQKEKDEDGSDKKPDKLLYTVGDRGDKIGSFNFPRGMGIIGEGDIYVADTKNHRLQIFNQCGVYIDTIGSKGDWGCEFNEPTDVAVLPSGDVAVADQKNHRIQILTEKGKFQDSFKTSDPPCHVVCDEDSMIIVSTIRGTVEVYDEEYQLQHTFSLPGSSRSKICICPIAVNDNEEIVVCDTMRRKITTYKYNGKVVNEFEPACQVDGLTCVPSSVDVNPIGQLVISDGLNHTVGLYSESGVFLDQIVGPNDDAGAIQAVKVGPEGHLVALEYTSNGKHSLKIFRYSECECHKTRPDSSRRTTPDD